ADEEVRRLQARAAEAERRARQPETDAREARRALERLAHLFDELRSVGADVATTHVAVSGASAVRLAVLERALGALLPGDPRARLNRLLAGLDGVESAGPALALDQIARRARAHPEWRAFLAETEAADGRAGGAAPRELASLLQDFLTRYGHRALSEGELRARTWRED